MHDLENAWGHWVLRWRAVIIPACFILLALALVGGRNLGFTTNYRVFFSADNPQLLAFDKLENTYAKNDNIMFVLTPKDGDVFTGNTLAAIEELTNEAWQLSFSLRVDSISNFQHTEAEGDDLIVRDLVEDAATLQPADFARIRDIALHEPLLVRRLVSTAGDVAAINVTVHLPGVNEQTETPKVVAEARQLVQTMRSKYPDVSVRLTGMIMMNNAFAESSQKDMKTLVMVSFALMIIFLAVFLRSISGTVVTVLVIIMSAMFGYGMAGHLGFPITPPSATSHTIILTVAIANSVHVLVTLFHEMRHGKSKREAIIESLRLNLAPVFLTSLTTMVTLLPALMSLMPVRVRQVQEDDNNSMQRFAEFVVRRRTGLLWGMGGFIIFLIAFIPRNELNDVFLHYFDDSVEFRRDSDYTTEHLTGLYIVDYSLESGIAGGISEPAFLRDVENFAQWFRHQPEAIHVNTITDIFKRLNKNMHADDASWYRLPDDRNLAAQYLLLYEMSLPYGLDLNNQINIDKSATRMTVSMHTLSTNQVLDLKARAEQWLAANTSHIKSAEGSGPTVMFAYIGKRNIISMLGGTTLALLMISMILVIALRSIKIGLISMIPNLVPAAMGFGAWGILVGEVGLALSVVTSMTLGIVVDDTVHFLSKYLRARRERGLGSQDAVRYAFATVGRALVITSAVLIIGFSILALSSFKLNSGMGMLTAMVIAFALAADFLLLPPLLMKIEEKSDENTPVDGAVRPVTA